MSRILKLIPFKVTTTTLGPNGLGAWLSVHFGPYQVAVRVGWGDRA